MPGVKFEVFQDAIDWTGLILKNYGKEVKGETWQSVQAPQPMWEVLNHSFTCQIHPNIDQLKDQIKPHLPWADIHFQERIIDRQPTNPGYAYKEWPFYRNQPQADKFRQQELFSHTYQERIWCDQGFSLMGIRYHYGDLEDVISLLTQQPNTRQAYLPIWFPEDTGVVHGNRVPCSLGYQFIHRDGFLHIVYYARSIDFIRHFRDDIYFASRKVLWMIEELSNRMSFYDWAKVKPGTLTFHITSLHCFLSDKKLL